MTAAMPEEDLAIDRMSPIEGWFSEDEGRLLFRTVIQAVVELPGQVVEVGSYKGRSTVILGHAARTAARGRPGVKVYAIDPHEGVLSSGKVPPTWDSFITMLTSYGLGDVVVSLRLKSSEVRWSGPIALLFIDGLHDLANVAADYSKFFPFVPPGGYIAFHDYSNPGHPDVRTFVDDRILAGEISVHEFPPSPGQLHSLIVTRKIGRR